VMAAKTVDSRAVSMACCSAAEKAAYWVVQMVATTDVSWAVDWAGNWVVSWADMMAAKTADWRVVSMACCSAAEKAANSVVQMVATTDVNWAAY